MRILIVDDDPVSRRLLKKILNSHGECVEAGDAGSALAAFEGALENSSPFGLVTLDIEMPGMDGTELLYEIRKLESRMNLSAQDRARIIMVTSHSHRDYVVTSIQAGCDDYILKPYEKDTINQKVAELVREGGKP